MAEREAEKTDPVSAPRSPHQMAAAEAVVLVVACGVRIEILELLAGGERCPTDLATALTTSLSHVSNHLKVLLIADVIRERRQGKNRFYSLTQRAQVVRKDQEVVVRIDEGSSVWVELHLAGAQGKVTPVAPLPRAGRRIPGSRPASAR